MYSRFFKNGLYKIDFVWSPSIFLIFVIGQQPSLSSLTEQILLFIALLLLCTIYFFDDVAKGKLTQLQKGNPFGASSLEPFLNKGRKPKMEGVKERWRNGWMDGGNKYIGEGMEGEWNGNGGWREGWMTHRRRFEYGRWMEDEGGGGRGMVHTNTDFYFGGRSFIMEK